MKKSLSIFVLMVLFTISLQAKVWTVSNISTRPAQFTDLQAAHDSAWAGDTILITGSTAQTWYNVTVKKMLVFIGEGNGANSINTWLNGVYLTRVNSSTGADSSKFFGVYINTLQVAPDFTGNSPGQANLDNVLFERCIIHNISINPNWSANALINKMTFRNCILQNGQINFIFNNVTQFLFTNSIFDNCEFACSYWDGSHSGFNGNLLIRNCIFINKATNSFIGAYANGLILENNIFYQGEPTGLGNSTFNNNITFQCNTNTIPYGTNVGSGNIINAYPKFINYPQMGGVWTPAYNFGLQTGSPAIGTGTNSTNIGLTGGNAPVDNVKPYAKIPEVTGVTIPVSSVPVGGNLQIQINAKTRE